MIINRSAQYLLQVLVHLIAHAPGRPVLARELAEQLQIPSFYLSKLLQRPTRAGWLLSTRGRGGGFALAPGAENITLLDVLALTKGERDNSECLLGLRECSDKTACVLHCSWKPIKEELLGQFASFTMAQLAASPHDLPDWLTANEPAHDEEVA